MDNGQMKNMVVLKNLPSNIIEEAIIILKANKKVKNIEYSKKNEINGKPSNQGEGYIVKEAEMVIANYLCQIEQKNKTNGVHLEKKYNRLKYLSFALAFVALVEFIII